MKTNEDIAYAIKEITVDTEESQIGNPSLKKPPPFMSGLYFFSEQLNKQIQYSVTKCHVLEFCLNNNKNSFIFLTADEPVMRNKFHNIRLDALKIISHYKEWLTFSKAMHLIFKKYDVEKYLI